MCKLLDPKPVLYPELFNFLNFRRFISYLWDLGLLFIQTCQCEKANLGLYSENATNKTPSWKRPLENVLLLKKLSVISKSSKTPLVRAKSSKTPPVRAKSTKTHSVFTKSFKTPPFLLKSFIAKLSKRYRLWQIIELWCFFYVTIYSCRFLRLTQSRFPNLPEKHLKTGIVTKYEKVFRANMPTYSESYCGPSYYRKNGMIWVQPYYATSRWLYNTYL